MSNFVDECGLNVRGGDGGAGCVAFRREAHVNRGGPDGGDGGRGGHIIIRANPNLWTLYPFKFKRHFDAGHGGDGGKSRSSGAQGEDVYIEVPLGTVVKKAETQEVLFEITETEQEEILLKGWVDVATSTLNLPPDKLRAMHNPGWKVRRCNLL